MLRTKDIGPGIYIMRNGKRTNIKRVWMGIIYGLEKEQPKGKSLKLNTKHIWFNNGQYNICGTPHELDLIRMA